MNKLLEISQEVSMAKNPVDLEVNLKERPQFKINSDSHLMPTGPNANLEKAKITSNSKIPQKIEKSSLAEVIVMIKEKRKKLLCFHSGKPVVIVVFIRCICCHLLGWFWN